MIPDEHSIYRSTQQEIVGTVKCGGCLAWFHSTAKAEKIVDCEKTRHSGGYAPIFYGLR